RAGPAQLVVALVEFRAEAPLGAAVATYELALFGQHANERLQPRLRRPMLLERGQPVLDLVGVRGDHGLNEVVLGLEVVVDVADGDIRCVCDVGEGRAFHALRMERLTGAVDQALTLAAGPRRSVAGITVSSHQVSHLTESSGGQSRHGGSAKLAN